MRIEQGLYEYCSLRSDERSQVRREKAIEDFSNK